MCLAIYKPANTDIKENYLRNGFRTHNDGAGIAWAENGVLHLEKGIFSIDKFLEVYERVKQFDCLIHFRKATHGKIDKENCHPFLFNDNKLALIHNGILSIKCQVEGLSDTAHFVKFVLEPLVKIYGVPINNGALFYLVGTSIGTDKMAVMDGKGVTYIINEDKGTWDEGVWYSNTSYKWEPYVSTTNHSTHNYSSRAKTYSHESWKKRWNETLEESDEAYLNFWRNKGTTSGGITTVKNLETDPKKTRMLLTEGTGCKEKVDDAGNVTIDVEEVEEEHSEGHMCEYGWFNPDFEKEIKKFQEELNLSREEAMIRFFNER